jgi:hypothetical protein
MNNSLTSVGVSNYYGVVTSSSIALRDAARASRKLTKPMVAHSMKALTEVCSFSSTEMAGARSTPRIPIIGPADYDIRHLFKPSHSPAKYA